MNDQRIRFFILIQIVWLATLSLLGGWWSFLVHRQGLKIFELESLMGMPEAAPNWIKTQRMVFWEFGTYLILVVLLTGFVVWTYVRDYRRRKSLEAFFASVTHELKTPLTSIRLQAESLAETTSSPVIKRLLEDTSRLENQVERTLELARVEGGGQVYCGNIYFKPWIDRFIEMQKESQFRNVRFKVLDSDKSIVADPTALGVVFKNLIENSQRHSKIEDLEVEIRAQSKGQNVEILYRDNGKGFVESPQKLGHLFARGEQSQGAGVGLYLVKSLMSRMSGMINFENANGFQARLLFREGEQNG